MSTVTIYRVPFDFEERPISESGLAALGRHPSGQEWVWKHWLVTELQMRKFMKVGEMLFICKIVNSLETRVHTCSEGRTNYSVMSSSVTW